MVSQSGQFVCSARWSFNIIGSTLFFLKVHEIVVHLQLRSYTSQWNTSQVCLQYPLHGSPLLQITRYSPHLFLHISITSLRDTNIWNITYMILIIMKWVMDKAGSTANYFEYMENLGSNVFDSFNGGFRVPIHPKIMNPFVYLAPLTWILWLKKKGWTLLILSIVFKKDKLWAGTKKTTSASLFLLSTSLFISVSFSI